MTEIVHNVFKTSDDLACLLSHDTCICHDTYSGLVCSGSSLFRLVTFSDNYDK